MRLARLELHSEPYGGTGNIGANFRKLLGAPSLDTLETVIREAVQNIADAAKLGRGPGVLIRIRTVTDAQMKVLRDRVLAELPQEEDSRGKIAAFLGSKAPAVMEICDFRTTGLGGPTRADRIPIGTETTDFIDFLRNVGTPRDSPHGGGTYGFGKVALYRASRCSTILVDSLVAGGGFRSRRFIGCHVGASYGRPERGLLRRYTGRHWWGARDAPGAVAEPVFDCAAAALSKALGFPRRSGGESGTSIMILDFDLHEDDIRAVGRRAAEVLLWSFWPRMMLDAGRARKFECRVEVQGRDIELPQPEDFPQLHLFAKAMRAARSGAGSDVRTIASRRPKKELGRLAIQKGLRVPRRALVETGSLFPETCHHIALMRPVELVVKYLEGAALPDERIEWAGVFMASSDDEVERAFAEAEPPAHDDWIPNNLPKGRAKTFVNVGLRELRNHAIEMGSPPRPQPAGETAGPPLARAAGQLGKLLAGAPGSSGAGPTGGGAQGGQRPRRASATRPVLARLEGERDEPVAVFETMVRQDSRQSGTVLRATATVAVEGAAAPSAGMQDMGLEPAVVGIKGPTAELSGNGGQLAINGSEGRFEIRVRFPPDCAVTVEAKVLQCSDP
ncbi:MAG: hypothetical protein OXN89_07210 [Bryobacterales bacterium]|nr:hypothetical protein [Bryobacterales bacterium]